MDDRQNTIVCVFDPQSSRITAYQIHECIYERLQLPKKDVRMIQIDGPRRRIFTKFNTSDQTQSILQATKGQMEFQHNNGELSIVQIELASMGTRRIRITNLPPEVPDRTIRHRLSTYGEVKERSDDVRSRAYRYPVSNGIHVVVTSLKKNIPSHMSIAGNRVLISYERLPPTCYSCNEAGHQYHECPLRRQMNIQQNTPPKTLWAVSQGTARPHPKLVQHTDTETECIQWCP